MGTQLEVKPSYTASNYLEQKKDYTASNLSAFSNIPTPHISQTIEANKTKYECLSSSLKSPEFKDYLNTSQSNVFSNLHFSYTDTVRPNWPSMYSSYTPSVNYDTVYSPRYYQPISMFDLDSSPPYKPYSGNSQPISLTSQSESCLKEKNQHKGKNKKAAKGVAKGGKSGKQDDPDLNNNFLKQRRGVYNSNPSTWADCNVCDRLSQLAQPKRLPCEYRDNRRSVYWMTKRPPPKGDCCNHTHFEVTPRLDELAQPKIVCGQFCGVRHCIWECEYPQPPPSCKDPREVDWCRLSRPKIRYPSDRPAGYVKKGALKACATKRLCKLSAPKKVIDCDKYYLWLWKKKPDVKNRLKQIRRLGIDKCDMTDMRIMVRCDLIPTSTCNVKSKIEATIPTIKHALDNGAKSVVIVSCAVPTHGRRKSDMSFKCMAQCFQELLGTTVVFLDDCVGYQARSLLEDPEPGSVYLLENLAFHPEEIGKGVNEKGEEFVCKPEEIEKFRATLFSMCDTYINDSFRELVDMTNSTGGYPRQEKGYGFKVKYELDSYNRFTVTPQKPMLAIVGGPYKETVNVVGNLMGKANEMLLCGEIALIFLRALKRIDIGTIECTPKMEKKVLKLHSRAKDTNTVLYLPSDVIVRDCHTGQFFSVLTREDIDEWFDIVDIGPHTRQCYCNVVCRARSIVWFGQLGGLADGTSSVRCAVAQATDCGALTFLADEESKAAFLANCPSGGVTHVTSDGRVTTMLLNGKLPKGLAALNPYRRKIKKRHPPPEIPSTKPIVYELPGMQIAGGSKMMCINDLVVEDKRVIIRVDFNLPTKGNTVLNNYRMRMTIPTIKYAMKWKARAIIILGHFQQPNGKRVESMSLKTICDELASLLGQTVIFVPECVGRQVEVTISQVHPGSILMLENVRFHIEETGTGTKAAGLLRSAEYVEATPEAIATFCEQLTNLGDVFVNDAFSCLHLDHSSITGYYLPPRVCGFLVKNELKYMAKIFNYPQRRFLVILGGLVTKPKIEVLKNLLKEADDLVLTGAVALLFLNLDLGMPIGDTKFDPSLEPEVKAIVELANYYKCRLRYPVDLWVSSTPYAGPAKLVSITEGVQTGTVCVDIGDMTANMFSGVIKRSKLIFWVGTAGITQVEEFSKGTKKIMQTIMEVTQDPEKNVISVVGGRSNSEFIHKYDPEHAGFTHITTGGIVALKLLTDRHLQAMDCLMQKRNNRPANLQSVEQSEISGNRILIRADLNLPFTNGLVQDSYPLKNLATLIKFLMKKGARSVVLLGHRGKPDGKPDENLSLRPIVEPLGSLLGQVVNFVQDGVCDMAESYSRVEGNVVLLENIRFHPEEQGITDGPGGSRIRVSYNDMSDFRTRLTSLGDLYVNEAFASLFNADSSLVGIKNIKKVAGPTLKKEVSKYYEVRNNLQNPFVVILGGDDILENMGRLYRILDIVDEVILCGAMAFAFLKVEMRARLGSSPVDPAVCKLVPRIMKKAKSCHVLIHLPMDFVITDTLEEVTEADTTKDLEETGEERELQTISVSQGIPENFFAADIGKDTIAAFGEVISQAKTIVLHGVAGFFDYEKYQAGTKAIMDAVVNATSEGATSIALGMKTGICLNRLGLTDGISIISAGIHSCFDILRFRSLPGLEVLDPETERPLKKLFITQMDLKDMRVLMRLDLFCPTIEGVVLDTDKLEDAAVSIKYALERGAKSVVLMGHRGDPDGFRNMYLNMEPLVVEFNQILETEVTFIDRPCSSKAKALLENPKQGSVFLMENLKFYPAEYGRDAEIKDMRKKWDRSEADDSLAAVPEIESVSIKAVEEEAEEKEEEEEANEAKEEDSTSETIVSVSDGEGGKSVDSLMFQLMRPKTVTQYTEDLAACGDVFINDDVTDIEENLTSFEGFDLPQRGMGFLLAKYIRDFDDPSVYNLPGLQKLSPAVA